MLHQTTTELTTRKDVENYLLSLTRSLLPYFGKDHASVHISGAGASYGEETIGFEGFARPLWGLAPFFMNGGECKEVEEIYLDGLKNGPDPEKECFWGQCTDNDQKFVEMGALAFALLATPEKFWAPLSKREKDNLASWLGQINEHSLPVCNWYWFRILTNAALKKLGMPYSDEKLRSDIETVGSWYLGDGCWVDGTSLRIDYYVPFALHLYPMLLAYLTGYNEETAFERAGEYYERYRYMFASDGASVPYGRSQTYRAAVTAFFSLLATKEKDMDKLAVMKGIVMRNLRYWSRTGMLSDNGLLSVGYEYPNLTLAERYNSPTSPYWAFKAFLCLLMDKDHPFWLVEEKENVIEKELLSYKTAGMILQNRGWDAVIYPSAAKQKNDLGHFSSKYGKFAYSSAFPFSVAHSSDDIMEAAPDSALAFAFPDGRIAVRRVSLEYEIKNDRIISRWSPDERISVVTEIIPTGSGHIRRHEISSEIEVEAFDSGFSLPQNAARNTGCDFAELKYGSLSSRVEGSGEAMIINATPNSNMKWKNTAIPTIKYHIEKGFNVIETSIITSNKK